MRLFEDRSWLLCWFRLGSNFHFGTGVFRSNLFPAGVGRSEIDCFIFFAFVGRVGGVGRGRGGFSCLLFGREEGVEGVFLALLFDR